MLRIACTMLLAVVLAAGQLREETISVNVDHVNVFFTVCNKRGRPITDLGAESFTAFEDSQAQTITHFSRETDVPVSIVLLIDTSGSVRDKLRFEQKAATDFLSATLRRGRDKAAVFTFDSVFEMQQDFTDAIPILARAINKIAAGGGT